MLKPGGFRLLLRAAPALLLLCAVAGGCRKASKPPPPPPQEDKAARELRELLAQPRVHLENYAFDPRRPLEERLGPPPELVLRYLREADGRPDYAPYELDARERAIFEGYLRELPPGMRAAFRERLIGIWFVRGLMGNGITDWARDGKGTFYAWIVLNPAGFGRTLEETLTERDRSAFRGPVPLRVESSRELKGVYYGLFHEAAHAFDYVRGLTPYVEEVLHRLRGGGGAEVSWDVWKSYDRPRPEADFPLRDKLRFYGFSPPLLEPREAAALCAGFAASPFASLYGSRSWAEDAADLVFFHHLTQVRGLPYALVLGEGKDVRRIEPLGSPLVRERARRLYEKLR